MMNNIVKNICIAAQFIIILCLTSNTVAAQNVTLPYGSVVSQENINKIFKAKTVSQLIELIENKEPKIISIKEKYGKFTEITVPKQYWSDDQSIIPLLKGEGTKKLYNPALYLPSGLPNDSQKQPVILVYQDISLFNLRQAYLYYLVCKDENNNRFSFLHGKKISRSDISTTVQELDKKIQLSWEIANADLSNLQNQINHFRNHVNFSAAMFIQGKFHYLDSLELNNASSARSV